MNKHLRKGSFLIFIFMFTKKIFKWPQLKRHFCLTKNIALIIIIIMIMSMWTWVSCVMTQRPFVHTYVAQWAEHSHPALTKLNPTVLTLTYAFYRHTHTTWPLSLIHLHPHLYPLCLVRLFSAVTTANHIAANQKPRANHSLPFIHPRPIRASRLRLVLHELLPSSIGL